MQLIFVCWFCILQLCRICLLFILSCHLWTKIILLLPFQLNAFYLFIFCLLALARNSNTMLNRSGKSKHPCLVPHCRIKLTVFHHRVWWKLWAFIHGLYYVEVISFCSQFAVLSWKGVKNLVKSISASIEMIMQFLSFILLIWCITLIFICWTILALQE